ncbi:MAG: hypothetical protein DRI90_13320, partial [Deltaproteobacteria bacterium]
ARNDTARVAQPGSVVVDELLAVQHHAHVMHLVSRVSGRLAAGVTSVDALRAAFPAGTLTGAPKLRAIELIAELERVAQADGEDSDGEVDVDLETGDTPLEHAQTAISSTLASHKDDAVEALNDPRSSVKVIVREASPATDPPPRPNSTPLGSGSGLERRLWVWLAVVAALAALAVGVWLGVR